MFKNSNQVQLPAVWPDTDENQNTDRPPRLMLRDMLLFQEYNVVTNDGRHQRHLSLSMMLVRHVKVLGCPPCAFLAMQVPMIHVPNAHLSPQTCLP